MRLREVGVKISLGVRPNKLDKLFDVNGNPRSDSVTAP